MELNDHLVRWKWIRQAYQTGWESLSWDQIMLPKEEEAETPQQAELKEEE